MGGGHTIHSRGTVIMQKGQDYGLYAYSIDTCFNPIHLM